MSAPPPPRRVSSSISSLQPQGRLFVSSDLEARASDFSVPHKANIVSPFTSQLSTSGAIVSKRPLSPLKEPVVKVLESIKERSEIEGDTIAFEEDPIAYFSKRKDGRGHRFIYLVHTGNPKDPRFNPYDLRKVTSTEIGDVYFTMSASGVTAVHADGNTETFPLSDWARDAASFDTIRRLKFFSQFLFWKNFRIWRKFVMRTRYDSIVKSVTHRSFYKNPSFPRSSIEFRRKQVELSTLLRSFLLSLSASKMTLSEFKTRTSENLEKLKEGFSKYIEGIQTDIVSLFRLISDPAAVQVTDNDFPLLKRRNPNTEQLIELEKAKAEGRYMKTLDVNYDAESLASFIFFLDTMILETLLAEATIAFKFAKSAIQQELAAAFQVEAVFSKEGGIELKPPIEDLHQAVRDAVKVSLLTLISLPRVINHQNLAPILELSKEMSERRHQGPGTGLRGIAALLAQTSEFKDTETAIIKCLNDSYADAYDASLSLSDFYQLFELGQTWDPADYLITREGKKYNHELTLPSIDDDQFLTQSRLQPIIEVKRLSEDLLSFKADEARVSSLRQGLVRGCVFVDSRSLRSSLSPIPQRSLLRAQAMIDQFIQMKTEQLIGAFRLLSRALKQEPQNLKGFAGFCGILKRANAVKKPAEDEIEAVEETLALCDTLSFPRGRSTLRQAYSAFLADTAMAENTRETRLSQFSTQLSDDVKSLDATLERLLQKAGSLPTSLKETDPDRLLSGKRKIITRLEGLESEVDNLLSYQNSINLHFSTFPAYQEAKDAAGFSAGLIAAVSEWRRLETLAATPFIEVDVPLFKNDSLALLQTIKGLRGKKCPLREELENSLSEIVPYTESLSLLAGGKMQSRHWHTLFETIGITGEIGPRVTIESLIESGALKSPDIVREVADASQREAELEATFVKVANRWNRVSLPLTGAGSEETLGLGNIEPLIQEISDSLVSLTTMSQSPSSQGIREPLESLVQTLDNIYSILASWRLFQANWDILSGIFALEESRTLMPQQAGSFAKVQRRWSAVARHAIRDSRLFAVCGFPSLLQVLEEGNQSMETITGSLGKWIEIKRNVYPRLGLLSDFEVVTFCAGKGSQDLLIKLFMCIKGFQGFEEGTITGIIGNGILNIKPLQITSMSEKWLIMLENEITSAVRQKLSEGMKGLETGINKDFDSWLRMMPDSLASVCLECYKWSNEKGFNEKVSTIVKLCQNQKRYDLAASVLILRESSGFPKIEWNKTSMTISTRGSTQERGLEFWGRTRGFIRGLESEAAAFRASPIVTVTGESGSGRSHMVEALAEYFGKPLFVISPYPNACPYSISRVLSSAVIVGGFAVIKRIDDFSVETQSFLFDFTKTVDTAHLSSISRVTIAGRTIDIGKGARIFATSLPGFVFNEKIPEGLRVSCRPVSLAGINHATIASIIMEAKGIKTDSISNLLTFSEACKTQGISPLCHLTSILNATSESITQVPSYLIPRVSNQDDILKACGLKPQTEFSIVDILKNNRSVILNGPPNSGKTRMIDDLGFPIETCFPMSDLPSEIFGKVVDDITLGKSWQIGQLQAQLYRLSQKKGELKILRLNTLSNPDIGNFIAAAIDSEGFTLPSGDTFYNISVVIETENYQSLGQSLISHSAVIQFDTQSDDDREAELVALFSDELDFLSQAFCSLALVTEKFAVSLGAPRVAAKNAVNTAATFLINSSVSGDFDNSTDRVNLACALFLFKFLLNVVPEQTRTDLETYIKNQSHIKLPRDWIGFGVPDAFWSEFNRPSLASIRLVSNRLQPIPFDLLEKPPIYPVRGDGQPPPLIDDIAVFHAQTLLPLFLTRALLLQGKNILLHGQLSSGKTSFLSLLFTGEEKFTPIYANSLSGFSTLSLLAPLMQKPFPRGGILVIEDLVPSSTITEALRVISAGFTFITHSNADPKVLEPETPGTKQMVVTASSLEGFSSHFLSKFICISIDTLSEASTQYMSSEICKVYNRDPSLVTKFIPALFRQFTPTPKPSCIFSVLPSICLSAPPDTFRALISSITLLLQDFPREEVNNKLDFVAKSELGQSTVLPSPGFLTYDIKRDARNVTITDISEDSFAQTLAGLSKSSPDRVSIPLCEADVFAKVCQCVTCPGRSLHVVGPAGSGKTSIVRAAAFSMGYDFVYIAPPTADEILLPLEREAAVHGIIADAISSAVIHGRKAVLYAIYPSIEADLIFNLSRARELPPIILPSRVADMSSRLGGSTTRQMMRLARLSIRFVISSKPLPEGTEISGFTKVTIGQAVPYIPSNPPSTAALLDSLCTLAINRVPYTNPRKLSLFLATFAHFSASDMKDAASRSEVASSAQGFLSTLEAESRAVDRRLDSLSPSLQRHLLDAESLEASTIARGEANKARRRRLEADLKTRTDAIETLRDNLAVVMEEEQTLSPKIEAFRDKVSMLTKDEIDTVRISSSNPPQSLRTLLEGFCVLLEMPPSYDRGGYKLLMDPRFTETLVTRISRLSPSPLLSAAETLFNSLSADEIERVAPALRPILEWARGVCRLASLSLSISQNSAILEEKEASLEGFKRELEREFAILEREDAAGAGESAALEKAKETRTRLESEFARLDLRKKSLETLLKDAERLAERVKPYTSFPKERVIGEAALFAFFLVFAGSLPLRARREIMSAARSAVITAGLDAGTGNSVDDSPSDPLDVAVARLTTTDPLNHIGRAEFTRSPHPAAEAHIVRVSLITPYIIDPDTVMIPIVSSSIRSRGFTIVSSKSGNIEGIACQVASEGKVLMITDAEDVPEGILAVLGTEGEGDIRIGQKVVAAREGFRMMLFGRNPPTDRVAGRVTVIDSRETGPYAVKGLLYEVLSERVSSGSFCKASEGIFREIVENNEDLKNEREALAIVSDIVATQTAVPSFDFLSDPETLEQLSSALSKVPPPREYRPDDMKSLTRPLKHQARTLLSLWLSATRILPKVYEGISYSISGFLKSPEHFLEVIVRSIPPAQALFTSSLARKLTPREISAICEGIKAAFDISLDIRDDVINPRDPLSALKSASSNNVFHLIKESAKLPVYDADSIKGETPITVTNDTSGIEAFDEMSLYVDNDCIKTTKRAVLSAGARGSPLIFHFPTETLPTTQQLVDAATAACSSGTGFKFTIVSSNWSTIPYSIMAKARKVYYESPDRRKVMNFFLHDEEFSEDGPRERVALRELISECGTLFPRLPIHFYKLWDVTGSIRIASACIPDPAKREALIALSKSRIETNKFDSSVERYVLGRISAEPFIKYGSQKKSEFQFDRYTPLLPEKVGGVKRFYSEAQKINNSISLALKNLDFRESLEIGTEIDMEEAFRIISLRRPAIGEITAGRFLNEFDPDCLYNPRRYLMEKLIYAANDLGCEVCEIDYEFAFASDLSEEEGHNFIWINVKAAYATISGKRLHPPSSRPITEFAGLIFRIVKKSELNLTDCIEIPLYKHIQGTDEDNFVWNLRVKTAMTQEEARRAGSAFYIRVPKNLL